MTFNVLTVPFIFLVSYLTKIYNIEKGKFVLWDEAHFGKFSQAYLDREFYFDVHPPLGKMLTALSGWIYGQSSKFLFSSTEPFPDDFDYVGMRRFHAFIASFVPVFAYLILRELKFSRKRCLLSSMLFIFDNGVTSISRLILLDSHLMTFTACTAYFFVRYYMRNNLSSLILLGMSLGCVNSVKWIGCFTTAFVGVFIVYQLYERAKTEKVTDVAKFLLSRFTCLIILPTMIYVAFFYLHFRIVNRFSSDATGFSRELYCGLEENTCSEYLKFVSFGKQITLKAETGYLHSHKHVYPGHTVNETGENSYQVTIYAHKDMNNSFYFQRVETDDDSLFLRTGEEVVILHAETKGYLEGLAEDALVSKDGKKVTCRNGELNTNNVWIVEGVKGVEDNKIVSLFTEFYLKHKASGMYLSVTGMSYPTWGFNQGEVTMTNNASTTFTIDENLYSSETGNKKHKIATANFFSNLIELHIKMFNTNKSFTTDPDLEPHRIESRPLTWFFLIRGLRMSQWNDNLKFYLFFNPLLAYSSSICVLMIVPCYIYSIIKNRRQQATNKKVVQKQTLFTYKGFIIYLCFGGWVFHYFPFFLIGRVLYIHHYFPAYFFAILAICSLSKQVKFTVFARFVILVVIVYLIYSPLSYGLKDQAGMKRYKILSSWDFVEDEQ